MPTRCPINIPGLAVGQATDLEGRTGVTVLRFDNGAVAGVDVRGAAPGTRETELLRPENLIQEVHAIVLSGGSVWGLDAMSGVAQTLEQSGVGFATGVAQVPIVTGAVLFDLAVGPAGARPDMAMGARAAQAASGDDIALGRVGAGTGATVGKLFGAQHAVPGGLGACAATLQSGHHLLAVVAVNAYGEVFNRQGQCLAGSSAPASQRGDGDYGRTDGFPGMNTTIGAVVTDATLSKSEALKVAQMAQDGLARAIRPAHTLYDGDTLFAAGTGHLGSADINQLGMLAADAVEQAIHIAVSAE